MTIRPSVSAGSLILVHAFDYLTFVFAVGVLGVPIGWEWNPLMAGSWLVGGPLLVLAAEAALVAIILAVMARVTTRSLWPPFLIGCVFGLVGVTANTLAIHAFLGGS